MAQSSSICDARRCQRPPWRRRANSSAPPSTVSDGAAGERCRTRRAATSRPRASPSTTAGARSRSCRRSRPRSPRRRRARSSRATTRPTSASTARSIPYRGCEHGCVYCFARPTHANMGLSAGLDFESQAVREAGRAGTARARARRAELFAARDRDRHQHRSVSADRAQIRGDARHPRSARARRPSGRHRHQVGAGDARHRHPGAHGAAQSGEGRALGDEPRSEARARHGAARRDAGASGWRRSASCPRPAFRPR